MKKILLVILALISHSLASTYEVRASLMGKIGEVDVQSYDDGANYSITADIKATGMAKMLSKKLHHIHKSEGFIKNGEYYATRYSVERNRGKKRQIKIYTFDYKSKVITKTYKKWKKGKLVTSRTVKLPYFTHIDGLNVYPYVMKFKKAHSSGNYSVISAGAERVGGSVDFVIADKTTAGVQLKRLGIKSGSVIQIFASKDFFVGGNGSLTFAIDSQNIAQVVELKEIESVGTIVGKRVN